MAGKVFLTGAGPGDHRLLTLAAADALKQADCIIYDRLADERILRWAKPEAELIYVGKSAGKHTLKQEEINQLLVSKAQIYGNVVRLKGGDPFVFGRGGEEALALRENNISFSIIPGVTSAIAVPAYAGIPVTQRGVAASFAVVTGHEDPNKIDSSINWRQLATATDTLIFLMGVANLAQITQKLIKNGRTAGTPAAFIRWGTKPEQEKIITTLGEAVAVAKKAELKPPAIFIVGEVVNLEKDLKWFDDPQCRPLSGQTVLVTRSAEQAQALTVCLEQAGAEVIEQPLIKIVKPADEYRSLDAAINKLATYDWIILTSVNGVKSFFARLFAGGKDARVISGKVAVIGKATATKLKEFGITADVMPEKFQAEELLTALKGKIKSGEKVLLARAEQAREILPEGLRQMGATVDIVSAYKTVPVAPAESVRIKLSGEGEISWVTFASPSAVDSFVQGFGKEALTKIRIACIGPITAAACRRYGREPEIIAEEYTVDGLVSALIMYINK